MSCFICPSPARPASYAAASSRQRSLAALTKQRSRNSTRSGDRAPPASTSRNHAAMSSSDMRPPSPHDATTRRGASANFSRADHGETDGRARVADGGLGKWRPGGWPQVHSRACRQRSCSASCSNAHGHSWAHQSQRPSTLRTWNVQGSGGSAPAETRERTERIEPAPRPLATKTRDRPTVGSVYGVCAGSVRHCVK